MPRPGASYWHDRFPKRRRPAYSRYRGQTETDVVVLGAGLTGCACAWSFASAGIRVIVLESARVGAGATLGSTGLNREDFDASFLRANGSYGLRASRLMWQAQRRASLEFASTLRRLRIRCNLAPEDLLTLARRDAEAVKALRREYQARRGAGLGHSWMTSAAVNREASIEAGAAIRTHGSGLDPYRACVGLAAAAVARGASIFEQSAARKIRPSRKTVDIVTAAGAIRASAVVITSASVPGLQALRRHLRPKHLYAVVTERLPAVVRRELGPGRIALRDAGQPPHLLRWLDGGERVLFAGAEQDPVPARAHEKVLVQRSGQLMYELSTIYPPVSGARAEWSWATSFDDTVDGLPCIGPHRNFPRQLFALGHGRHGLGAAWLAARVLLRQFASAAARGDEHLGFARIL
jgi:gamma-glutamylputrescine oxidase